MDKSPPVLTASSYSGRVDEASSPGTIVTHDDNPNLPITLSISDPDLVCQIILNTFKSDMHNPLYMGTSHVLSIYHESP